MRHVTLTCKNHTDLRWSCKSIAFRPGYGYNGARNIFFYGRHAPEQNPSWPYSPTDAGGRWLAECPCSGRDLILAPEDPDYGKDGISDAHPD